MANTRPKDLLNIKVATDLNDAEYAIIDKEGYPEVSKILLSELFKRVGGSQDWSYSFVAGQLQVADYFPSAMVINTVSKGADIATITISINGATPVNALLTPISLAAGSRALWTISLATPSTTSNAAFAVNGTKQ